MFKHHLTFLVRYPNKRLAGMDLRSALKIDAQRKKNNDRLRETNNTFYILSGLRKLLVLQCLFLDF